MLDSILKQWSESRLVCFAFARYSDVLLIFLFREKLIGDRYGVCVSGEAVSNQNAETQYEFTQKKGVYTAKVSRNNHVTINRQILKCYVLKLCLKVFLSYGMFDWKKLSKL